MKVLNDVLNYEELKIYQRTDMFSFSLDSVLLARFLPKISPKVKNILDVGTNNAIIPLIISLYTKAKITGVEIQEEAVNLAHENLLLNNKEKQIMIVNDDYNNFAMREKKIKYDIVYCNPPFFALGEAKVTMDFKKLLVSARHEVSLTLSQLITMTKKIIKNQGSLIMVHRAFRLAEIMLELEKNNFIVKRLQFIYPFVDKKANSVLIEAKFQSNHGGLIIEPPIIVHNKKNEYSSQVKKYFKK